MKQLTVNYRVQDAAGVHNPHPIAATIDFSQSAVDQPYVDWPSYLAPYALRFATGPAHLVSYLAGVNYPDRRIDSSVLLPERTRCLT